MKVTLVDYNTKGIESMIEAIGICRGKGCTEATINSVLEAKPVPHMSVLEFGWAMVKVEGVSIKTRLQEVRHRLFSPIERSTRALDMSNEEVVVPETVKDKVRFAASLERIMSLYMPAVSRGETLEDASYLLPMAVTTKFYLAGNIRTWFEYFEKRLCKKHVQDEHYRLAVQMWILLQTKFPVLKKAHPCKKCGTCQPEASNE